jgi:beta-glucanase (GH16 family)
MTASLRRLAVLLTALVLCACSSPDTMGRADAAGPVTTLDDEFDGPAGTRPSSLWRYDQGGGGWGNGELQVYTDDSANVGLDGQGHLAISARTGRDGITSARLTTKGSVEFTSGRAEARISLPAGAGLHPAFWLLGSDIDRAGWPGAGEIDVIETTNDAAEFNTGLHAPAPGSARGEQLGRSGPAPFPLPGVFHTYWVERTPERVTTGIDDVTLFSATPSDLPAGSRWVFDKPFFLLLNVAVGGTWPGPPDANTPDPATMLVDWVRVSPL